MIRPQKLAVRITFSKHSSNLPFFWFRLVGVIADRMSKAVTLVTSATSRNGIAAAKLLLEAGKCSVRLGARNPAKLAALAAEGAEPVTLDDSLESATAAFKGVTAAYTILPGLVGGGVEERMIRNYLQAAKQAHTQHIVYLSSQIAELPDHKLNDVIKHREFEQLVRASGIPYTILRAASFHDNWTSYFAFPIKHMGQIPSSAGDGVYVSVAVSDIAAIAAAALTEPAKHANKVYSVTGEALSNDVLAEKVSKAIGKKVTHVKLTPEEHKEMLKKTYPGSPAQAEVFADMIVEMDSLKRNSTFSHVEPDLEQVLGRKATTVDEFLAQNAQVFL